MPNRRPAFATSADTALDGMAWIEANGFAKLAELGAPPPRSIRTVGGGAANAVWSHIRQNKLGVPEKPALSTSAAAGVAWLALKAMQN